MDVENLLNSELSASTLAALQQHFSQVNAATDDDTEIISEDFRLSQFWYSPDTAERLAKEAMAASNGGRIGFVSTPAAFHAFKRLYPDHEQVYLFEYDKRFDAKYPLHFVFYNYHSPLEFPAEYKHSFDYILSDPPHLNVDAVTKYGQTMHALLKKPSTRHMLITGMLLLYLNCIYHHECICDLLMDPIAETLELQPVPFQIEFSSKLSNGFLAYSNYTLKA